MFTGDDFQYFGINEVGIPWWSREILINLGWMINDDGLDLHA